MTPVWQVYEAIIAPLANGNWRVTVTSRAGDSPEAIARRLDLPFRHVYRTCITESGTKRAARKMLRRVVSANTNRYGRDSITIRSAQ